MAKIGWEEERDLCSAMFSCSVCSYVILKGCDEFSVHLANIEKLQN